MTVHSSKLHASDSAAVRASSRNHGIYALGAKRLIDIVVVLAVMPFVLPFAILTSALIAIDGHSPFFRQERVGMNGKRFGMWKFRTMVPDAEKQLERYLSKNDEARAEWKQNQKLTHDPRCTVIGRILRRTSIDELPQLLNVLVGDMSLVGPRPMLPKQQALYPGHAYYRLRPGLTGPWQVSERHKSTFAARAGFDDHYEEDLSLVTDLSIVARTVGVVLRGTGV